MANYYTIAGDTKKDIDQCTNINQLPGIEERIDKILKEFTLLKNEIEPRKNHIQKHIVKKYYVSVWKRKTGIYRDANLNDPMAYVPETHGSHYSVHVHEYVYDTSLIGTMSKSRIESDRHIITVPYLSSAYDYQKSKEFSWKRQKIAFEYANDLCRKFELVLKPAVSVNDECMYVTGNNNPGDVWGGK